MSDPMTEGIKTVLHPVSDMAAAKAVYTAMLGVEPHIDEPYYVSYRTAGQQVELVPSHRSRGAVAAVVYWQVQDIATKLAVIVAAGGTVKDPVRDVGGGRLVATFTDSEGYVVGLLQDP